VKAAGRYGLNPTARALRLDYYALKKRVAAAGADGLSDHPSVSADRREAATFVELVPSASGGARECILELENPGGSKMRVHLKGVEAPDLTALSRSFWGVDTDERCPRPSSRKPTGRRRT